MDNFVADGIFVDASPERVLDAILAPEDIVEWMDASEAEADPAVGARFRVTRNDGSTVSGKVTKLIPGDTVHIGDYFWERNGERRGPMRWRCVLSPRHGGVWITMRQDDLDASPDGWKKFAEATRAELVRSTVALKRHVEGI